MLKSGSAAKAMPSNLRWCCCRKPPVADQHPGSCRHGTWRRNASLGCSRTLKNGPRNWVSPKGMEMRGPADLLHPAMQTWPKFHCTKLETVKWSSNLFHSRKSHSRSNQGSHFVSSLHVILLSENLAARRNAKPLSSSYNLGKCVSLI